VLLTATKYFMLFPPFFLLLLVILITIGTASAYAFARRRREVMLIELAKQWKMHYSPHDVFNLAPRISSRLPTPGAADVRVRDLIYGSEPDGHRYIFCADYTIGVLQSKCRRHFVATVLEPRDRTDTSIWSSLQFAPLDLSLLEQYRSLKKDAE
jgi:hypothetical protein